MFKSWYLGRVQEIDIFLNPTLVMLALYVLASGGIDSALLVIAAFGCVFLHEMGHALMARCYGIRTAHITLYPIGGVAALERMPRSAGPELLIALAGPAVNFALAIGLWCVMALGGVLFGGAPDPMLVNLLYLNLGLGLFNLLPIFPMDGGRIFRALLSGRLGRARATAVAASVGQTLAMAAGLYFLFHFFWIQAALAAFVYLAAGMERARVLEEESGRRRVPPRSAWPEPPFGFRWAQRNRGGRIEPILIRVVEPSGARTWH
ncbi:M50 family metallopeptidase [Tundrisphaera sp. TA3]|uniref:M50 family metallopeptidase n=1 Tax=Tundrisphaera sp. TA3 TaxID=3435775 RepID=UPI003EBB481C